MHSALEAILSAPSGNSAIRVATHAQGPLFVMFLTMSFCPI